MSSLAGGDRGGEAVAAHHLADRGGVGRASPGGAENRCDLLEIARSEEAGRRRGKELRVVCAAVLERVNCPARDEDDLAGMQFAPLAVDGEGRHADEAVVGLVEAVMTVRGRHHRVGRDVALECRGTTVGGLRVEHERDAEGAEADGGGKSGGAGGPRPGGKKNFRTNGGSLPMSKPLFFLAPPPTRPPPPPRAAPGGP